MAAGAFFTPPVPVGGARALQLGAEGGLALHGIGERGWAAVEQLRIAAGASADLQQSNQNEDNRLGASWKLDASAAQHF